MKEVVIREKETKVRVFDVVVNEKKEITIIKLKNGKERYEVAMDDIIDQINASYGA